MRSRPGSCSNPTLPEPMCSTNFACEATPRQADPTLVLPLSGRQPGLAQAVGDALELRRGQDAAPVLQRVLGINRQNLFPQRLGLGNLAEMAIAGREQHSGYVRLGLAENASFQ